MLPDFDYSGRENIFCSFFKHYLLKRAKRYQGKILKYTDIVMAKKEKDNRQITKHKTQNRKL